MRRTCGSVTILLLVVNLLSGQELYTLQKTLQAAKTQNLILKAQSRSIELAEGDMVTSKLRPNPVLNNQTLQLAEPAYFAPGNNWMDNRNKQIWWQVTKPFLLPGVRKSRMSFAENNLQMVGYSYSNSEREFLLTVAEKWIDAWLSVMLVNELQTLIKSLPSGETNVKDLENELLKKQLTLRLRSTELTARHELSDLQVLMNTREKIKIDSSNALTQVVVTQADSIVEQALSQRPDLLFLKQNIETSAANIRMQKALALPTPELGFLYNPQNTVQYVGLFGTIQIPIFARNQGEIKKANVMKLQAEDIYSFHVEQARTELRKAINNYNAEKLNLEDYRALLQMATDLQKQASGKSESSEKLTEANKTLSEIKEEYYESVAQYLRSCVQLLFVSGTITKGD